MESKRLSGRKDHLRRKSRGGSSENGLLGGGGESKKFIKPKSKKVYQREIMKGLKKKRKPD